MSLLIPGRIASLVFFLFSSITIIYITLQGAKGRKFELKRRLAAIDAIPETIGRAVELNKPVHYTPGCETTTGGRGVQTWMGIVIGGYVTRICARLGAKVTWSVREEHLPMSREIYKEAFRIEGFPGVEPDVRYYGAFSVGCIETMAKDGSAVNMIFGGFGSEFPQIAEAAARLGCFQIGGCSNPPMVPLVVAACDYFLIGEENFAAGAILSENDVQLAGIVALDIVKVLVVGLIALGTVLMSVRTTFLVDILKL